MTVALFLFFKVRFKNPVTQNLINRIAVFVLIATGIVLPQIIGSIQTDYSHKSQFLSELGATDAPYQLLNNYGSLLPIGIAAFVLVFGLYNKFPRTRLVTVGITLLFAVGISYLSGFFFACDPGCPVTGSLKQNLHIHFEQCFDPRNNGLRPYRIPTMGVFRFRYMHGGYSTGSQSAFLQALREWD